MLYLILPSYFKVIIIKTKVVVKAVTYLRLFECNFGFKGEINDALIGRHDHVCKVTLVL